ncbi:hypothetical protein EF405_13780 [Cyclobacteriaceae bacterium YHN15]|nr:hypothetical protein EF405_13780 [Cyclobacteriaceae bacterium YHN15]
MLKTIPIFFLLFLFWGFNKLMAQTDYLQGYIIGHNLDTVYGHIKDRKGGTFAKIYKKIRFKGNGIFVKKYSPKRILGYKKGEDVFESHWIETSTSFLTIEYLSRENLGKKYFLKVKQRGFLTYYHWEFLEYDSFVLQWVDLFKRSDEDYFVRVTQGVFGLKKKRLERYFEDCPELMEKIHSKELRLPAEIARFYNDWLEVK